MQISRVSFLFSSLRDQIFENEEARVSKHEELGSVEVANRIGLRNCKDLLPLFPSSDGFDTFRKFGEFEAHRRFFFFNLEPFFLFG